MAPQWKELRDRAYRKKTEGHTLRAIDCFKGAIACSQNANPRDISRMHNMLSKLLLEQKKLNEAEKHSLRAIAIEMQFGDRGRETTELSGYLLRIAYVLEAQKRFTEAANEARRSLEIYRSLLGPDNDLVQGVSRYVQKLQENCWRG
jgi:tetratricopeptide (TPR) repeat protein